MRINKLITLVGHKGEGKSYAVKHHILPHAKTLVIIVDPRYEYGIRNDGEPKAVHEKFLLIDDVERFTEYAARGALPSCVIRLPAEADYEALFKVCSALTPHTLVVEEIADFVSPQYLPEGLEKIARFGRHRCINLVSTTQRPKDFHPVIRSQTDHWILFRMHEPDDIRYLSLATGCDCRKLQTLPKHHYLRINR